MVETVRTIQELRAVLKRWRQKGETVGLVPTMGGLHAGHLSLVRLSRAKTMRTCVTLFVNPKQFAPTEDLDTYPRDEDGDLAKLEAEGVDLVFQPGADEVYPAGYATSVHVGGLGDILEGEHRPGFFTGVATVVTKLLVQALPDIAVFGEKDYQQLLVIRRLTRDLDIPVRIESVPIVRDDDGLALSSRNAYLSDAERKTAPVLFGTLSQVAENVGRGANVAEQAEWGVDQLLHAGFAGVDYLCVRDADSLDEVSGASRPARVLAAATLGSTRLIDNVAV
ncbi:MAG: pantoate--beta-alanine ligase [Proteobacteria bacterium]|nr:pantoate--beta-alanine ligase [Pseudomonadota bacterium]